MCSRFDFGARRNCGCGSFRGSKSFRARMTCEISCPGRMTVPLRGLRRPDDAGAIYHIFTDALRPSRALHSAFERIFHHGLVHITAPNTCPHACGHSYTRPQNTTRIARTVTLGRFKAPPRPMRPGCEEQRWWFQGPGLGTLLLLKETWLLNSEAAGRSQRSANRAHVEPRRRCRSFWRTGIPCEVFLAKDAVRIVGRPMG